MAIKPKCYVRLSPKTIEALRSVAQSRGVTFSQHLRDTLEASLGDNSPPPLSAQELAVPEVSPSDDDAEVMLAYFREHGIATQLA